MVSQAVGLSAKKLICYDFLSILIEKWKLHMCSMLNMGQRIRFLYDSSEGVHDDESTDVKDRDVGLVSPVSDAIVIFHGKEQGVRKKRWTKHKAWGLDVLVLHDIRKSR